MVLLFQTTGFLLLHDPLRNWLCATWVGQQRAEVMRQHYDLILRQAQRLKCSKLLNDSTENRDGWRELTTWLAQACLPELAKSGIQAVAWVLLKDPQAFRDAQRVVALAKEPLLDVFYEVEAAHNWLRKWPQ